MSDWIARARKIGGERAAKLAEALAETAAAELPPDLTVERAAGGIVIRGARLIRRIAYDGRLRGLAMLIGRRQ